MPRPSMLLLVLAACSAKADHCTGIEACGCTVINKTITDCRKNSEKVYLHNIQTHTINRISPGAFAYSAKVKELHLSGNNISKIELKTFTGLAKLEYLFLSENNITSVHRDAFSLLFNLQYVSMAGNPSADCPSHYNLCYFQNTTKFPCCTDKQGEILFAEIEEEEQVEEEEKEDEEKKEDKKEGEEEEEKKEEKKKEEDDDEDLNGL